MISTASATVNNRKLILMPAVKKPTSCSILEF
jgi:hypothetical protein